ncbi:MAG: InlB B-repeat-containing protein, partial [Bacteroidales bacterium]|nr:InlB B-repeat-containing protein [Bacteroidales bacterium]
MRKAKSIVISVLLAACAACLAFALVGCDKKEKTATKYGYGEEGVYYYDATGSSTRYMLNLYGGSYMLAMDDVMTSAGTYSLDEDTRTITFSGSDEKFSAGIAENVLSMDFTDSGYTFLRYVYFDVTFRNADGTVLATQQVLNGKAAEPVDCSLEGYYFIDWYGDAALSKAYGFNTSVTADTDIYGWYVEKNPIATDFWVTYDFGNGVVTEPVKTQNGTIYALPEADGLLGWWISDTNNGEELTGKYEAGTVLDSDTILFAVYNTGSTIGASVTDGIVTWENVIGQTVTITIYSGDTQVLTTNAASSGMRATIGDLSAGTYTVVVESGSASETLTYVVHGLARVSGFEILNGTVISFSPVANATGYTIEITNGVRSETIDLGNSTVYNISGWEMTAEGLTFTVTAHAAGYADSVSDVHNYTAVLDAVVISIADDTVTWNTVEHATSYEVEITVNGVAEKFTTYYTSMSLKNYNEGDVITISVRPVASGYYSEATISGAYKKTTLAAPVIENVIDGVITWSKIVGATGYTVNINGEIIATLEGEDLTEFRTSDQNFVDGQGTYTVMVRAIGQGTSSAYSDAVIITEKDMGETLTYENGTVSWQYSFAASSYIVQVNDENETIVTYGNTANVTFTKAGDNKITVYFLDENGEKSGAASITIFAYEIVLDAREDGTVSTDVLYVAMGDEIVLPDAVSSDNGLTFDAWYTLPDYSPEGYEYSGKGVKIENGSIFTGNSNGILYAYYTPSEFTITIIY